MHGKLITIEGIDGSGKSSICKLLQEDKYFKNFVFTCEPTIDNWISEAVNYSLKNNADNIAELMLFLADHAQHIATTIRPNITEGKNIISDRYYASRCSYQGVTLQNTMKESVKWIQSLHYGWTIKPDLTIILDIDPKKAVERCDKRGMKSKFEKVDFLKQVRSNFLNFVENEPKLYKVVDADQSLENVKCEVSKLINNLLNQ